MGVKIKLKYFEHDFEEDVLDLFALDIHDIHYSRDKKQIVVMYESGSGGPIPKVYFVENCRYNRKAIRKIKRKIGLGHEGRPYGG